MGELNFELQALCKELNCQPLTFSGRSEDPWSNQAVFSLIDEQGETVMEETVKYTNTAKAENDSSIAVLWAASASPYADAKLPPLGATYGFVDRYASLLALESDAMSEEKAALYEKSGVPRFAIQGVEIVLPDYEPGQILDPGFPGNQTTSIKPDGQSIFARSLGQGSYEIRLSHEWAGKEVELTLYDLHGKKITTLKLRVGQEGWIRMPGVGMKAGTYLVAIRAEGVQTARRLILP
jgi:hypothetical protein